MFMSSYIGNLGGFDKRAVVHAGLVLCFSFKTLRQVESHVR
jgi:hypothetical protein